MFYISLKPGLKAFFSESILFNIINRANHFLIYDKKRGGFSAKGCVNLMTLTIGQL